MARVYPVSPSSVCTCTRTPVIFATGERCLDVAEERLMRRRERDNFFFFFFVFDGFLVRESIVRAIIVPLFATRISKKEKKHELFKGNSKEREMKIRRGYVFLLLLLLRWISSFANRFIPAIIISLSIKEGKIEEEAV